MVQHERGTAYYHLPGLFEFYELYRVFLPLFREHREYFYDWCEIGSVYGAPADCIWGGGRTGFGDAQPHRVLALMQEYGISARLTFSNSLLRKEHAFFLPILLLILLTVVQAYKSYHVGYKPLGFSTHNIYTTFRRKTQQESKQITKVPFMYCCVLYQSWRPSTPKSVFC